MKCNIVLKQVKDVKLNLETLPRLLIQSEHLGIHLVHTQNFLKNLKVRERIRGLEMLDSRKILSMY